MGDYQWEKPMVWGIKYFRNPPYVCNIHRLVAEFEIWVLLGQSTGWVETTPN